MESMCRSVDINTTLYHLNDDIGIVCWTTELTTIAAVPIKLGTAAGINERNQRSFQHELPLQLCEGFVLPCQDRTDYKIWQAKADEVRYETATLATCRYTLVDLLIDRVQF